MEPLEEIKRKKLSEYSKQQAEHTEQQQAQQVMSEQKNAMVSQILSAPAKSRLTNIKLADPAKAEKIEDLLLYLAQSGQVKSKVTDEQLKVILAKITANKREPTIKRV